MNSSHQPDPTGVDTQPPIHPAESGSKDAIQAEQAEFTVHPSKNPQDREGDETIDHFFQSQASSTFRIEPSQLMKSDGTKPLTISSLNRAIAH